MKILKNGIKIRELKFDLESHLIKVVYEKGVSVQYKTLTFEFAEKINFINFNNLSILN